MRAALQPGVGPAAPALPGGQSLVADGSGTYSIDSRARLPMAARRCCGSWCAAGGNGCRDRPTRRCAGRREHRDVMPCATALGRSSARWPGARRLPRLVGPLARRLVAARVAVALGLDRGRLLLRAGRPACRRRAAPAAAPAGRRWRCAIVGRIPRRWRRGVDGDPLAAGAGAGTGRPAALAAAAGRRRCCAAAAAAGRRRRTPARRGGVRDRPADAVRRRRGRVRRARPRAATSDGQLASNWWWCRAPRWTRNWPRSGRWPQASPASTSPAATAAARRQPAAAGAAPRSARSVAAVELGARRRRACSRSPRAVADARQPPRRRRRAAGRRRPARSRRRARRRSSASSWSTWSKAALSSTAPRSGRPTVLEVLDELTRRLPDDT